MKFAVRYYTRTGHTKRLAEEFKGIHKGRPNEEDLKAAAEFARAIKNGQGKD